MPGEEQSRMPPRCSSATTLPWNYRASQASIILALERLATSLLVRIQLIRYISVTNSHSPISSPFDKPTTSGRHLTYSDVPRLLPLSHQSLQGLHPLEDAETDG